MKINELIAFNFKKELNDIMKYNKNDVNGIFRNENEYDFFSNEFIEFEKCFNNSPLLEMTRVKDSGFLETEFIDIGKVIIADGTVIGYQDGKEITGLKKGDNFLFAYGNINGIVPESIIIGYKGKLLGMPCYYINGSYTLKKFRGQKNMEKMMFWIKEYLKLPLTNTKQQSPEAVGLSNKLALDSRFNLKWVNTKNGKEEPYNIEDDSKYRSTKQETDWQLIIEGNYNNKSSPCKHPFMIRPLHLREFTTEWDINNPGEDFDLNVISNLEIE